MAHEDQPPLPEDITTDFIQLVNNEDFSDITFNVNGTIFHGHKAILSVRSKYFREMFIGAVKQEGNSITKLDHETKITQEHQSVTRESPTTSQNPTLSNTEQVKQEGNSITKLDHGTKITQAHQAHQAVPRESPTTSPCSQTPTPSNTEQGKEEKTKQTTTQPTFLPEKPETGMKKKDQTDDIVYETFYHRSGKEFQCMYLLGMRFYLDSLGSKEWQPLPKKWYQEGLLITNTVIKQAEVDKQKKTSQAAAKKTVTRGSGDDREGIIKHPRKGKIVTYIFQRKHNIHCFFDHDTGQWMRMPIGYELHHDLIAKLVDQVNEALPHWNDRHDILALLRQCNYDADECINTYSHLEGDEWLITPEIRKETKAVSSNDGNLKELEQKVQMLASIQINDVDDKAFAVVLHYIYTNKLPNRCDSAALPKVWRAANKFSLDGLMSLAVAELSSLVTVDNVIDLYVDVMSSTPVLESVKLTCESIMLDNVIEIVKVPTFRNLPRDFMVELIQKTTEKMNIK